jgi:BASS family bile acid:Na+ symporter
METNLLTTVILPIALGIIMLGLGLGLSLDDFKRVALYPKAIVIGLICQMVLLPVICFIIAIGLQLPPELAVGLMLLAASPGGPTANLYSHLAKGDVALNISLTAINSLLTLISLPFIVNFSLQYFLVSEQAIPMQFKKIIEVFLIVLIPVILGMLVKAKKPEISERMDKPVRILSALFLALIIISAIVKEKANVIIYFQEVGLAAFLFNVLSMMAGYFIPQLFSVNKKQAISIGMEIGIHNGTLAIYIALNVLGNSAMSIPPAIYSLIMFFTAAFFGYLVNKKQNKILVN